MSMSNSFIALKDQEMFEPSDRAEFADILRKKSKDEPPIEMKIMQHNGPGMVTPNLFNTSSKSRTHGGGARPSQHIIADNQSNSVIGQNLFDPSANNSVNENQMMYHTGHDIFNMSHRRSN